MLGTILIQITVGSIRLPFTVLFYLGLMVCSLDKNAVRELRPWLDQRK